jgi:anti-sigma regulatory factor (Ser/Thr protein kinase)
VKRLSSVAANGVRDWCRLPREFIGEVALQLRPAFSGADLNVDATGVQSFDAVGVATLASWKLRAEAAGGTLAIREPEDRATRLQLRAALGAARDGGEAIVLPARPIATELDVKAVAAALGARLRDRVPKEVATTAVLATSALADNAATHARERFAVAAAHLGKGELAICVRDRGAEVTPEDAHLELIERIQLPLESDMADWGAAAGIAWIAHLFDRHQLDAELLFASGTGRLHVSGRAHFCGREAAIEGFAAVAKFAV